MGLIICNFAFVNVNAQQSGWTTTQTQLRNLFMPLQQPSPSRLFLYDMSAHLVDSTYFSQNSPQPHNSDNWFMLYEEMQAMAYNPAIIPLSDSIFAKVMRFDGDTIPIGIMHYDFYALKSDAMNTNNYFNFDTTNTILTDKNPRTSSPYLSKKVFAISPLKKYTNFGSVTFRIDPAFIFRDQFNSWSRSTLQVDFGDGNGWITINNPNIVNNYKVIYGVEGEKEIQMRLIDNVSQTFSANSVARLVVPVTDQIREPDEIWNDVAGLQVGVYRSCRGSNRSPLGEKFVIYLEGIDIIENRGLSSIYEGMIQRSDMAQLQNFGYTFLVINWKNSRKDIKENAWHLMVFIRFLKARLAVIGNRQPFVMVGESMGGLVARYALCRMEQNNSAQDGHNTRLLITIDTPHQGANIPLSVQTFYRDATNSLALALGKVPGFLLWRYYAAANNILLDSQAAKQMLIYHVDTRNLFSNPIFPTFQEHGERIRFLQDLAAVGNYPQFCKKIALSNGSLTGTSQNRHKYDLALRQPNDFLLDFNGNIYVQILGIRIKLIDLNIELNTNPEGRGQLVNVGLNTFVPSIRLFWFGVRIQLGRGIFNYSRYADTKAVCTNAGGFYSTQLSPDNKAFDAGFNAFVCSVRSNNNGNGLYEFDFNVGVPWLANGGTSLRIYSDGFHWCFIPTQSALDYQDDVNQQGRPLNSYNIWEDDINLKLQRTPFDVIIGIPDDGQCLGRQFQIFRGNMEHLWIRNESLPQGRLTTCNGSPNTELIRARQINREIGDEELWLDNYRLVQPADFEAEHTIFVNRRFPNYQYFDSNPNNTPDFIHGGLYSKAAPFNIVTNTVPVFRFENSINYNPPFSNAFQTLQQPVDICCLNYARIAPPLNVESEKKQIQVYPNPVFDKSITIRHQQKVQQKISVRLTDLQGRERFYLPLVITDKDTLTIDLSPYKLEQGIYVILVSTSTENFTQKIIIH